MTSQTDTEEQLQEQAPAPKPPSRGPGVNVFDESKPMWQTMLVFLIPLMLSNVLQSASQTLNYIFLGRMISVHALAAVAGIFPLVFLLFAFLIGTANGSTVLIGQAFGAGDDHKVKKVAGTALGASIAFSFLVAVLGWFFSAQMLHLLQTPAAIFDDANLYTKVIFAVMPLFFPGIMYTTFLRGVGDAKTPLYLLILGAACGLILTPAFIKGWFGLPAVGVIAPALAGAVSQLIILPTLFIYLARTNHPLKFTSETARDLLVDPKLLWIILKIGIPTGFAMIVVSLAEIAVVGFVNHFGADATAAYGAVNQIIGYVQFPAMSLGIAASIFGAQCIGARREDKLGEVIRSAVALNYAVNGLMILLCYIFASQIIGLFITDPGVVTVARGLLSITLWAYLLWGNSAVLSGVMRSSGSVLWPTINSCIAVLLVEVPSAYILMHHYGLSGVWMGYPIAYAFVLCAQFTYYTTVWKKKTHERLI